MNALTPDYEAVLEVLEGPINQKVMSIFFCCSFLFLNVFLSSFICTYFFLRDSCLDKMKSHEIQGLFMWSDVMVEGV